MRGLALGCAIAWTVTAGFVTRPAFAAALAFEPTTSVRLPNNDADGFVAGDFNGDGRADLAVWQSGTRNVYTLLGNGDGTFAPPASALRLDVFSGAATGDVNGDGFGDVVFIAEPQSAASVYYGDPGGALTAGPRYDISLRYGTALADLNRDGHPDLITTKYSDVQVRLNDGRGAFGEPVPYTAANTLGRIVVGDFNRDGNPDVATTDLGSYQVVVLPGRGDGTLEPARSFHSNVPDTRNPALADFDRDGRLDVAVAGGRGDSIEIQFGAGDGNLERPTTLVVGGRPENLAAGDFNGDGLNDLATFDMADGTLRFLAGRGDGTFAPPESYATPREPTFDWSRHFLSADFNGDGRPDVATLTDAGYLGVQVGVPEPGMALFSAIAAAGMLRRRRRTAAAPPRA